MQSQVSKGRKVYFPFILKYFMQTFYHLIFKKKKKKKKSYDIFPSF